MKHLILLTIFTLVAAPVMADPIVPPDIINYQGRVMQNGANFNGTGHFKFMLLNQPVGTGTTTRIVWKNDGTLSTTEPSVSVQVTVQDGQFTVPLGDTGFSNAMEALPANAFGPPPGTSASTKMSLRIWFRPGATGTFTQFTPDVAVNSVPFALSARAIDGKPVNQMISQGDPIAIATGTFGPVGLDTSVAAVQTAQHGVAGVDFFRAPIRLAEGNTIDWSYAVLSATDASVSFFDLNEGPTTLTRRAVIRDNVGGFTKLAGPTDLFVDGDSVYVTSGTENAVTLINYEGTSRVATLRAEFVDGANGLDNLDGASAVVRVGSSAEIIAVASATSHAVSLISITGTAPTLLSTITGPSLALTGFTGPSALNVLTDSAGRELLFVACPSTNSIFAFDVTVPASPALRWTRTSASGGIFVSMIGPARFGRTSGVLGGPAPLAVVCPTGNAVILVNSETGASLSAIKDNVDGFDDLLGPAGVTQYFAGLAIACRGTNNLVIADISDPTKPRFVQDLKDGIGGFTLLGGCNDVLVGGPLGGGQVRTAVLAETDNALTIASISSGHTPNQVSLSTSSNIGVGTKRPHARIEAFDVTECLIRASVGSTGDAALQLFEYDPTNEEIPFGYEWRYDGGTEAMQLNTVGFVGAIGTKATFTKTGNMTLQGTLTQGSDRARKENITKVDPATVLEKVAALPVSEWNYLGEGGVRHVGPMSQDFRAAFGLGNTDKGIASVDADGVALAAIQALKSELDALKKENADMRARLQQIETRQPAK